MVERPQGLPRIACLAWGSLVWRASPLRLRTAWAEGGPVLPLEFCRVGDKGELATALCEQAVRVPTRWAVLDATDLAEARETLREREGIDPAHLDCIGAIPAPGSASVPAPGFVDEIAAWSRQRSLDGVVWTASPPRFAGQEGRVPTLAEALVYLQGLRGETRRHAHDYIRRVPVEIRTPYRAEFQTRLGLMPIP